MHRKSNAATPLQHTVFVPSHAPAAPESAPAPVRRRRARAAAPKVDPKPVEIEIDLTQANAKDALAKAFPRPTTETMIAATEDLDKAATDYMNARDAATIAEAAKERAGNVLRYAIKSDRGIKGDGWEASWLEESGGLDVSALLKHLMVPEEIIAQFQRPKKRVFRVKEIAK